MATFTTETSAGLAQVIGESQATEQYIKGREKALVLAIRQREKQQAEQKEVLGEIGTMLTAKTWARDAPYFQEKGQKIREFAQLNMDALSKSDPKTTLELDTMKAQYLNDAQTSINMRERVETAYIKAEADPDKIYDQQASFNLIGDVQARDPGDFTPTGPLLKGKIKDIDLVANYQLKILPTLVKMQSKDAGYYIDPKTNRIVITTETGVLPEQVESLLRANALNPEILSNISRAFANVPKSEQIKHYDPENPDDKDAAVKWYIEQFQEFAPGTKETVQVGGAPPADKTGTGWSPNTFRSKKYSFGFESIKQPASFAGPETQIKHIDISTKDQGEIKWINFPYQGKDIKGVITDIYQNPGQAWKVKVSVAEDFGERKEKIKKGSSLEFNYDSVKRDIISKYGFDMPTLYEDWERQKAMGPEGQVDPDDRLEIKNLIAP